MQDLNKKFEFFHHFIADFQISMATTTEELTTEEVTMNPTTDAATTGAPDTTTIASVPTTTTSQSDGPTTSGGDIVYNYDQGAFGLVYPLLGNTPPTSQMYSTIVSHAGNHPVTVILNPDTIECVDVSREFQLDHSLECIIQVQKN